MSKVFRHMSVTTGRWVLRIVFLFAFIATLFLPAFVWRVSQSPLDISFARDYVQGALYDNNTGNHVLFDRVVLFWPDLKGPLYIQIKDVQLLNREGISLLSIAKAAFSFSRRGLFLGKVLPKEIILEDPVVRVSRDINGSFDFDIGSTHEDRAIEMEKHDVTTRIFEQLARPGYENTSGSLVSRLESMRIQNARLVIDDEMMQQTWSLPGFNAGFKSTSTGIKGSAHVKLPNSRLDEASFSFDLDYIWGKDALQVSADLTAFDLGALAKYLPQMGILSDQEIFADARINVLFNQDFIPEDVRLDVRSDKGAILYSELSDTAIPYSDLVIKGTYNYKGKFLRLQDSHVTLKDVTVHAEADIKHTDQRISGPVKVWIDGAKQSEIAALWPKFLRGDSSEEWIVGRLSEGVFKKSWAQMNLVVEQKQDSGGEEDVWHFDAQNVEAEFIAENMRVDYRAPLMAATKVNGSGRFDLETDILSLDVKNGNIGDMTIDGSRFIFDEVAAVGAGGADLEILLKGPVADVFRYISSEPINLKDDINMDLAQVRGDADLKVRLQFPTNDGVRLKDFQIDVDGILTKANFPDVIDTLDLSGGPFNLSLHDGFLKLSGKEAMLDNRPIDFTWETFLESEGKPYKEKISAKIMADPNIRMQLGIDLSDFIQGSLPIDAVYASYRDGTAKADINIDVTNALFFVDPFDYEKKPGEKAEASFTALFEKGVLKKIRNLKATGSVFSVSDAEISFSQIDGKTEISTGVFPSFVLEETVGTLGFSFDDQGTVDITLDAAFLDVQPFMDAEENAQNYEDPPMRITVNAKTMRTAPQETVRDAQMFYDIDDQGRFNQMQMQARVGVGGFVVQFKPDQEGRRVFRMRSDDAGAMLKAFQVYNNIRGGEMVIYGEPIDGIYDRNIKGNAEITNFKVVNAPALTKILSILSLTGIGEALTSNGLAFTKLETDFSWLYRKGGSLLVLKEGRTSGNSLGLLFDGTFDNAARRVDVSGTVVPMSGLNAFIGSIPLVGEILTGGSGGVFAAAYSVTGSSEAPEISVNPLSVLTPGIIRRVLFE